MAKKDKSKSDDKKIKAAMKHPDKLGAGAAKRKKLSPKLKVKAAMAEYGRGTLRSGGSGKKVKNQKQAVAIALSEAGKSRKSKKK